MDTAVGVLHFFILYEYFIMRIKIMDADGRMMIMPRIKINRTTYCSYRLLSCSLISFSKIAETPN